MVSLQTHTFKTIDSLELKLDIYTIPSTITSLTPSTPAFLFFHGGGLVGFNRKLLPAHVVQASLSRGWPLISSDYQLLHQVTGKEIVEDASDAYTFVWRSCLEC